MNDRTNRTRKVENEDRAPRPSQDQGFARGKDVEDKRSQAEAPKHADHDLDRTGEKKYEDGLRRFEKGEKR